MEGKRKVIKKQKFVSCDCCGRIIQKSKLKEHGNRVVGDDGQLTIHLSVPDGQSGWGNERRRTLILCSKCWEKVVLAVRLALKLEEK